METNIIDLNRELAFLQMEHQAQTDRNMRFRIYWNKILPKKQEITNAVERYEELQNG